MRVLSSESDDYLALDVLIISFTTQVPEARPANAKAMISVRNSITSASLVLPNKLRRMSVSILSWREDDISYVARVLSLTTSPNSRRGSQMPELETSKRSDGVFETDVNTEKQNY